MSDTGRKKRAVPVPTQLDANEVSRFKHGIRTRRDARIPATGFGPLRVKLAAVVSNIEKTLTEEYLEKQLGNVYIRNFEYMDPDKYIRRKSEGDKRLADLKEALEIFDTGEINKLVRAPYQKLFHDDFIEACIKVIYKEEYSQREAEIIRMNGFDGSPRQEVAISCPRRFGKSIGTVMFVVALLLTQPNIKITVFSPSLRQSSMITMECKKYLLQILGDNTRIVKSNIEQLFVSGDDAFDVRELRAFPSNPEKIRGVTSSCVIVDEMAFIDPELFYQGK